MGPAWKITIIVNNYVRETGLRAEHGLAMLFERIADGTLILLDTSQTGDVLLHNAEKLGIDWSRLSTIVLSHGHYDHTGGLMALLEKIPHRISLLHHPDAFAAKAALKPRFRAIGAEISVADFHSSRVSLFPAKNEVYLAPDLWVTGEVPRLVDTDKEASAGFYLCRDGVYAEDPVSDDKSIVIHKPGLGYYLLCGCCHSGLVNTLRYVKEKSPDKKLLGVVGGIHTVGASKERLDGTIRELKKEAPELLGPIHCSGQKEAAAIYGEFGGEVCKFFAAGESFLL